MKGSHVRELRAVPRYGLTLPVSLSFRAAGAPESPLSGFTRDISTRGMFVIAGATLAHGDLLEFEIDLKLDEATPLVVVQGAGRVVRIERRAGQPSGFAVHNLWFCLCEPEQGQALPLDLSTLAAASAPAPVGFRKPGPFRRLAIVPPPIQKDQVQKDADQGESQ